MTDELETTFYLTDESCSDLNDLIDGKLSEDKPRYEELKELGWESVSFNINPPTVEVEMVFNDDGS